MATPYQTVYNAFLSKITDYNLSSMSDTLLTNILRGYLGTAMVMFKNCKQDLTNRDDANATWNITLTDDEIEILALYMVDAWYNVKLNDDKALNQVLTDGDFQIHSQQAHTKTTMDLRDANYARIKKLIKDYQYNGDLSGLSTNQVQQSNEADIPYDSEVKEDWYGI